MSLKSSILLLGGLLGVGLIHAQTPIRLNSDIYVSEVVNEQGTRYRGGGGSDFDCRGTPTRENIGSVRVTFEPNQQRDLSLNGQALYETFYPENIAVPPKDNSMSAAPQMRPLSREEIRKEGSPWNWFRNVVVGTNVGSNPDQSYTVNIVVTDTIKASLHQDYETQCTHVVVDYIPEKDVTKASFKISYWLPENVEFTKVDVNADSGMLTKDHVRQIHGTFRPEVDSMFLEKPYYVWADFKTIEKDVLTQKQSAIVAQKQADAESNKKALEEAPKDQYGKPIGKVPQIVRDYPAPTYDLDDRRIDLILTVDTETRGGANRNSGISVRFTPLKDQDAGQTYAGHLEHLVKQITAGLATQDFMLPSFGYLIGHERDLLPGLAKYSLSEIEQLVRTLNEFALQGATGDASYTPLVKAVASVLATQVSEALAHKLLPACELVPTQFVPVVGTPINTQRYVYLLFNLNRIKQRLEYYEPPAAFEIGRAIQDLGEKHLTYKQVASDPELTARLQKAYDVYKASFSQSHNTMSTAEGEYQVITKNASSLVSQDPDHRNLIKLFAKGTGLENAIVEQIDLQKTLFNYKRPGLIIDASSLVKNVATLERTRKALINKINNLSQKYLFSARTVGEFKGAIFQIFDGLNLNGNSRMNDEIQSYYEPIFKNFFDQQALRDLIEQISACETGTLKAK